jgi:peptidoglycan L-alanyl-D-glutamate endopeptidase CwlK
MSSRKLEDLSPKVEKLCREFIALCAKNNIEILITCTYRSLEEQALLYRQGRSVPGHIVTNAKPGFSYHNYKLAFDFVPIVNGKAVWNDKKLFDKCGEIGESVGLEWAGRWTRFREADHMQLTEGITLAQLRLGAKIA